MRLIDTIARMGISGYGNDLRESKLNEFRDSFFDVGRFDISNVSDYVEQQIESLTSDDMPNLRLPFDACWMECGYRNLRAGFFMTSHDDGHRNESRL